MEFDSESGFQDLIGNGTDKEAQVRPGLATPGHTRRRRRPPTQIQARHALLRLAAATCHVSPCPPSLSPAHQVSLSYLKSYQGMGTADLACVSGCECPPQRLDGTWAQEVSLQQVLQFYVTRHKACRLRVTVSDAPGQVAQDGHKVRRLAWRHAGGRRRARAAGCLRPWLAALRAPASAAPAHTAAPAAAALAHRRCCCRASWCRSLMFG